MKTAGMILGLIGSLVGIFGGFATGVLGAVANDTQTGDQMMAVAMTAAIFGIVMSIFLGVAKKKRKALIAGGLLIIGSVVAFIASNFFSAPLMLLGGILGMVGATNLEA